MRMRRWSTVSILFFALAAAIPAAAGDGGGGGGDGGGDGNPAVQSGPAQSQARPVGREGAPRPGANRVRPGASASTTLPDGTVIRSQAVVGGRVVTTTTPDGVRRVGGRPPGVQPAGRGQSRTTYNPRTGITSTWTRNADGTVTGVHVDRQGNRSVSTSRPRG